MAGPSFWFADAFLPVYNVRAYGAAGDGVADDTAAILAADAAACNGTVSAADALVQAQGIVFFPPGTYKHTGLTYRGAPWIGSGRQVTTLAHVGGSASYSVDALGTTTARRVVNIRDLSLDGTSAPGGCHAIRLGWNTRSTPALFNVTIHDYPGAALYWADSNWLLTFIGLWASRCAGGAFAQAGGVSQLNALTFYDAMFESSSVTLNNQYTLVTFVGGTWEDNGTIQGTITDCYVTLIGVDVEAAAGSNAGLLISGAARVLIEGGQVSSTGGTTGISVQGTARVRLESVWMYPSGWTTALSIGSTAFCELDGGDNATPISVTAGGIVQRTGTAVTQLTDAASIAVDASLGNVFVVTLGGNRTIANPTNPSQGQIITFSIWQDATGSRTVSWDTFYYVTWSNAGNSAGKRSSISFIYWGNRWNQVGAQGPYV